LTFPVNTGVVVTNPQQTTALDVTGDGVDDLVWFDGQFLRYRGGQIGSFSVSIGTLSSAISGTVGIHQVRHATPGKRADFNGDGREDVLLRLFGGGGQVSVRLIVSGASPTEIQFAGNAPMFADLNGDGLGDVVYVTASGNGLLYRLSRGLSLGPEQATGISSAPNYTAAMDWDGDGFDDLVSVIGSNGNQQIAVARSTGEVLQPYVVLAPTDVASLVGGDVNGDGLSDVIQPGNSIRVATHLGVAPDLLLTATDGFGVSSTFSYASTGNSTVYQRLGGSTYPTQEFSGPMYVVSNVQASNGIGGTYNLQDFSYEAARVDLIGRGFLGFAARSWVDSRNGIRQRQEYRQDFPLVGKVKKSQSIKVSSNTVFSEAQTTYQTTISGGAGEQRYLFNASSVTQYDRELGGTYNGVLVRTAVTTNIMDLSTGTVYDSTTVITEGSNANGLNPGQTYTQRTLLPLANMFTDTADWCIGRPGKVQQIGTHTLYGGTSLTRTADVSWYGFACRPTQTVIEPGNATLQVTTDLGYDSFGNLAQQSVTPVNEAVRVSLFNWGTDGRFPRGLVNALSQPTTFDWWPELGLLKSVTDPNGLTASSTYDSFGRPVTEVDPDGTSTLTEYLLCDADCTGFANTKYKIRSTFRDTAGGTISQGFVLLDAFDRVRRSSSYALEGGLINRLVEYNGAGQVLRASTPYFSLSGTPIWTTFLYDASAGRRRQLATA
jgi:YD repeat-containing protein